MNAMDTQRLIRSVFSMALAVALGLAATADAQRSYDNPLRPARKPVTQNATVVQPAIATEPVHVAQRTASPIPRLTHRQVSFNTGIPRHATPGYVPRHEMVAGVQALEPVTPLEMDDDTMLDPLPAEGEIMQDSCGSTCNSCETCGQGCLIPCPIFSFRNIELFTGVQGVTGPMNQGNTGSFGLHYGLNWGAPLPCTPSGAFGMQIGFRGVSSNYSGSKLTPDTRNQQFLTAGLFRRVDWGLQGGVVFDYLHDEWYYDTSLTQIRGELSWVYPACHELGFWFTARGRSDTVATTSFDNNELVSGTATFEPFDMFAFFYRRRFESLGGGAGRIYAGFTGNSDGLIGADIKLPLTPDWALQSSFTYVIPDDSNKQLAYYEEAWNVGITLVWYPGQRKSVGNDYFRPLFDVADNGTFIAHLK